MRVRVPSASFFTVTVRPALLTRVLVIVPVVLLRVLETPLALVRVTLLVSPFLALVRVTEVPFLFFKGVMVPQSFDLSEEMAHDIETFMKGQNSEYYTDLRLHDLEQPYLDAYESAIRIYNDMVEKTRDSYHASVKLAKTQVFEISAVFVCLFVLLLTVIGIS